MLDRQALFDQEKLMKAFSKQDIQAEYVALGLTSGWNFILGPEQRLRTARVCIVGLNPGGGGDNDAYTYPGEWEVEHPNPYFPRCEGEKWARTGIQAQVQAWHRILDLQPTVTFCAQFVPFRSSSWASFGPERGQALEFARRLWSWTLKESPARLYIAMGRVAGGEVARLLNASDEKSLPAGWKRQFIRVAAAPDGRRVITMPHPSRYLLFNRVEGRSAIAEQSLRLAAGV